MVTGLPVAEDGVRPLCEEVPEPVARSVIVTVPAPATDPTSSLGEPTTRTMAPAVGPHDGS